MTDRKERERELHKILAHEYDEKREGSKNGRYYSKEWLRWMVKRINIPKHASILDIGCGTGILYEILKEEKLECKYVGIDLSESMIEVGKKRYPGIDLQVMDSENLDFKDKSFDIVFMRSVLHHLPHPVKAIQEMSRVSRGVVLISEPSKNILTEFPRYLAKKFTSHFDPEHTHYSKKELKTLLQQGNITDFKLYHFGYLAYPWGFTDILPFANLLPLFILKILFKLDLLIAKIPLLNHFSWHITAVCNV